MVRRRERIRDYAARIFIEGNNEPMAIDDIRRELGRHLKQSYLPNPRGLSSILLNSGCFLLGGDPHERTYSLKTDVYKKLKRRPADS